MAIGSPSAELNATLAMKIDRPALTVLATDLTVPEPGARLEEMHVELKRDGNQRRHDRRSEKSGEVVGPRGKYGRPQMGCVGHAHFTEDRGRAF